MLHLHTHTVLSFLPCAQDFAKLFMQETIEHIGKKSRKYGFIHSATIHQGDELFSVEQSRGIKSNMLS